MVNISAIDIYISAPSVNSVGGLVGDGRYADITSSSVVAGTVSGDAYVGGLVGYGESARISSSSVVADEISGDENVGGLVGYGESARISSSSVVAGTVSGHDHVGGLVGYGDSAVISSSSVVADTVSGRRTSIGGFAGGLVGWGRYADITSSSVVAGTVSGSFFVGGLVGAGPYANISSSSVVADEISAYLAADVGSVLGDSVGGLVGGGSYANISSSSVVADTVSGRWSVGGLVGLGPYANISSSAVVADTVSGGGRVGGYGRATWGVYRNLTISSSSAVAVGTVSGRGRVGGLVGDGERLTAPAHAFIWGRVGGLVGAGEDAEISSSLVLGGAINGTSHVGGIVGSSGVFRGVSRDPDSVEDTYWLDSARFTNSQPSINNTFGARKTKIELQAPTSFTGIGNIYANWANAWCDPATGQFTSSSTHDLAGAGGGDTYRAWDLGGATQFPVLTCFGDRLTEATQHQKITEILDPDGDWYFRRGDTLSLNDPSEHADTDGDTVAIIQTTA